MNPSLCQLLIVPQGALLLSNQVAVVVHDLEQKRVDCIRTRDKIKKEKKAKSFKVFSYSYFVLIKFTQSPEQLEKEKNDSKWETSKVN